MSPVWSFPPKEDIPVFSFEFCFINSAPNPPGKRVYRTSTRLELCRSWPRLVDDGNFISFVGICMLIPRLASALLVDGVTVSYFYLTSLHWFPRFFPYFFFFSSSSCLNFSLNFLIWCFIPALYFSPFKLLSSFCDEDLWQRSSIRCIKYQKPFNHSLSLSQSDSKTWIFWNWRSISEKQLLRC